jgi:hypothetical protein
MIEKEQLQTIKLASTKMNVPMSERLFEALNRSTKITVLKL